MWGSSGNVHAPAKPFADRAVESCDELREAERALDILGLKHTNVAGALRRAQALLKEAVSRGLKGKEPA